MFVRHVLDGERPCNLSQNLRSFLSQCHSVGNGFTTCHSDGQHLLFVMLLASELENLWSALSHFAHNAAPQIKELVTVYLNVEFYKQGIDYTSDGQIFFERFFLNKRLIK